MQIMQLAFLQMMVYPRKAACEHMRLEAQHVLEIVVRIVWQIKKKREKKVDTA